MGQPEQKPKRGRPSKGKRGTFTFRVEEKLREALIEAAENRGRSVSEEIERRLESTLVEDFHLDRGLREYLSNIKLAISLASRALPWDYETAARAVHMITDIFGMPPDKTVYRRYLDQLVQKKDEMEGSDAEVESAAIDIVRSIVAVTDPPQPPTPEEARRRVMEHVEREMARDPSMEGMVPKITPVGDGYMFKLEFEKDGKTFSPGDTKESDQ